MHKEILNHNQMRLLSLLKDFKREFYLVSTVSDEEIKTFLVNKGIDF